MTSASEAEALVERLREAAPLIGWYDGKGHWQPYPDTLLTEAASLIERLQRESVEMAKSIDIAAKGIVDLTTERASLRTEVERLQEQDWVKRALAAEVEVERLKMPRCDANTDHVPRSRLDLAMRVAERTKELRYFGSNLAATVALGFPTDKSVNVGWIDPYAWWDEVREKVKRYIEAERALDAGTTPPEERE